MKERHPCPRPDPVSIKQASDILRRCGVVAFPTETSYGLGASTKCPAALERIFAIKKRPKDKPLLVLISDVSEVSKLAGRMPEAAVALAERFWPGPLTLLLPAKPGLPWPLCGGTGKVGVRISSHPWSRALVNALGDPVTATSANLAGHPPACTVQEVADQLRSPAPDYILDGGPTSGGLPSTIIDVCSEPPRVVRKGAISISQEDIPALRERGLA